MVKIRVLFITILYISSVTGKSQLLFDNYSRIHSAVNNAIHLDGDILVNDEEYKKKLTSSLYSYWCYSYESTQRDMANKETMYIPYCFDFCINYKEKKYQLEFYRDTPPAESVTISAGTFSKQGEEFILKDRLNGHELRVKKIQDCFLYFSKGYFCFSKKLFGNYKKNQSKLSECNPDSSFLLSVNQSASIKRPIPYPTEGVYAYKSTMMVLEKDNLFSYYIDGVMLLKGCWEQKGNRLKLYDQTLKYNFYGKITPQGIQSVYLPGDREGVLLKKIKD